MPIEMSNPNKHICKLQEFPAHNTDVTCLAIGHNSGLVLATGGADNNVNLWKVDDAKCFMSLCGHVTPIECVQFDPSEYLVGSGSHTGGLNIWDLTKGKKVKTFSGHKLAITKLEFFPFASSSCFLTGSKDTNVKLWDYRYSHCIGMYKGHDSEISSLKYSPDGLWFVSGDNEGCVKVWDLRVGKMLHCFDKLHNGIVTSIEFHPLVFLLVSSGTDNKINILDLERFDVISQINTEKSTIRCLQFNDKGNILYGSAVDFLGVYGIEPTTVYDTLTLKWGNMNEFVVKGDKIVGASHISTNVSTWLINLPEEYPFKNQFSPPDKSLKHDPLFTRSSSVRKSFNKQKSQEMIKPKANMKLIDENEPDTDSNNYDNVHDYHTVFKPNRTLNRSPLQFSSLSEDDTSTTSNSEVNRNQLQKYTADDSMKLDDIKPNCFEIQSNYSDAEISTEVDLTSYDSFSLSQSEKIHNPYLTSSVSMRNVIQCDAFPNVVNANISKRPSSLPIPNQSDQFAYGNMYRTPQPQREPFFNEFSSIHHKQILTDDFIDVPDQKNTVSMPKQFELPLEDLKNSLNNVLSDEDILETLSKDHKSVMDVLKERQRNLIIIQTLWINKNFKSAVVSAISMNDKAIISDLISIITQRPNLWCLEVCALLLPSISSLIQSCNEPFINVAFKAVRDILHFFMPVINVNMQKVPSAIGVDITQEERFNKCRKCHSILMDIRTFVLKKQTVQGNLGNVFRQLHMLLQNIDV